MAIDHDILRCFGGDTSNSLIHILNGNYINREVAVDGEPELIDHSPYYDQDQLINILTEKQNSFNIFSMNCQSLNAKVDELRILFHEFENSNCFFDAICLQETWLDEHSDTSLLAIEGYNLISQGKLCSAHSGLVIYLHNSHKYKILSLLTNATVWDGQFIEVTSRKTNTNIIIGNIYRPPRELVANYQTFINELLPVLSLLQTLKPDVVIAGDTNINLLKVNENKHIAEFFDAIISQSFYPKITLPTRFSDQSASLIDNFFCKLTPTTYKTSSGILLNRISDHLPYFICLEHSTKKQKVDKLIEIKNNNIMSMNKFRTGIEASNIWDKLDKDNFADPNENYHILETEIIKQRLKHLPTKKVKYKKHKHKKSGWITHGIIRSIVFRDKLYRTLKQTNKESPEFEIIKTNLKTFNKLLKKNIIMAKKMYYQSQFSKYKDNMKGTWAIIKGILNRTQPSTNFPEYFNINGQKITDKKVISNEFNSFFTNIGANITANLSMSNSDLFKGYLCQPTDRDFRFAPVSEEDVIKIIHNLKPKSSCGFDEISVKLNLLKTNYVSLLLL